ncbi:Retrovirus-related Pol polyprotein from transposon TNT 1-94 [Sesamum angolense]|uniref:Retrovirus-related Pol polyprotein from transposon TNT 1-94 n=1 Tax=Sesamum angolense TaxID=2727404 RepID=A0AAE1W767_9LAMI|nr:Retrovirus-related Pol polyprotein from transposon TNT 1-94 [Sesamum angolense]
MKDLGEADVILGVKIRKTENGFSLCQSHYIEKILKRFNCHEEIPVRTPYDPSICLKKDNGDGVSQAEYAKIIGSVMFLMNYTRPDIAYAVSRLSRYTHNPNKEHWFALRRLLKYLKATINLCLYFNKYPGVLEGFCDANWVTDNDEVSSTSGYVFTLGGGGISWKSAKQTCIARSTMESEFIALELAGQEAEWLRNLIGDIPLWGSTAPVSLHCDSQAAIEIAKNYAYNGKRRHIRLRHSAVKELLKNGIISLDYVRSKRNLADPLTKGLTRRIIQETSRAMGLKPLEL